MKRKLLSTVVALSMTASMTMPVFAAQNDTQTSNVPVVGKVGRWQDGTTNPDGSGGGQGQNGEITKPDNVTDINVTIPTLMTFDVVTNTNDGEPVFATGEYTVTNNAAAAVNMSGTYNVVNAGDINLVNKDDVAAKAGDGAINLALDLNSGANADTPFITNVKEGAKSAKAVEIGTGASTKLKFNSDAKGMADVKLEAQSGSLTDTKTTTGNLVLTFEQQP